MKKISSKINVHTQLSPHASKPIQRAYKQAYGQLIFSTHFTVVVQWIGQFPNVNKHFFIERNKKGSHSK